MELSSGIRLRNHEMNDIEDVLEISRDPLVQQYLGGVKSDEEIINGFEYVLKNGYRFKYPLRAVVYIEEKKLIGYCGMQPLRKIGFELYFGLNSKYWGKGFCHQAVVQYLKDQTQGMEKIFATVHPENIRSKRVLAKVGFTFEKVIYYEPQKTDHNLYSKTMI